MMILYYALSMIVYVYKRLVFCQWIYGWQWNVVISVNCIRINNILLQYYHVTVKKNLFFF